MLDAQERVGDEPICYGLATSNNAIASEGKVMGTIRSRIEELSVEYAEGQRMLSELDGKRRTLRQTLLRISGAIQVLEELRGTLAEAESTKSGVVFDAVAAHSDRMK